MKIYLVGPDICLGDADEVEEKLKLKCQKKNAIGLSPLNDDLGTSKEFAEYEIKLIKECDCIIANCNDFRGLDMDSRTAFEIGYAVALKKPIFCYCDDMRPLIEKYGDMYGPYMTENFGLPLNILIAENVIGIYPSFDKALDAAVDYFKNKTLSPEKENDKMYFVFGISICELSPSEIKNEFDKWKNAFDSINSNEYRKYYYDIYKEPFDCCVNRFLAGIFKTKEDALDFVENNGGDFNEAGTFEYASIEEMPLNCPYPESRTNKFDIFKYDEKSNAYKIDKNSVYRDFIVHKYYSFSETIKNQKFNLF